MSGAEEEPGNVVPKVQGSHFRCQCGCNVFHKLKGQRNKFICNGCGLSYYGEPVGKAVSK